MSLFDDLAASPIGQYYKSNWNLWTGGSGEELSSRERPVDVDHGPYAGQQTWRDADGDPVGWSGKFGLGNHKDKQGDDVISVAQGTGNLDVGAFRDELVRQIAVVSAALPAPAPLSEAQARRRRTRKT